MESRKPLDLTAVAILLSVCCIWGFQQIGLKATAHDAAPVLQIAARSGIAAVLVFALIRVRGERVRLSGSVLVAGIVIGVLVAVEFLLLGESLKYTSASHAVVFLYTAPIFAALGLHWKFPSERLAVFQWMGIAVASLGIVVAFFGQEPTPGTVQKDLLIGDALALAAGATWGLSTILIRSTVLSELPASHILFYQLVSVFFLLWGAAYLTGRAQFELSPMLIGNLLFQAIIVSFLSFLVWFWMLTKYVASQLGVFSLMTPLFGVALGWLLLNEPLDRSFLIGAGMVLLGIVLVSAYPWLRSKRAAGLMRRKAVT